jgi:hypothetical protein
MHGFDNTASVVLSEGRGVVVWGSACYMFVSWGQFIGRIVIEFGMRDLSAVISDSDK